MIAEKNTIKVGSNKGFGIVFSIFFLLLAVYFYYKYGTLNIKILFFSVLFLILGIINSKILTPLNLLWFKFGIILSLIISPIIMSIVFFLVLTPIAILAKIVKKDFLILNRENNLKKKTYWIIKEKYNNSMKDQF